MTVITRAYGSDQAYKWESSGADGYTIEEWTKETVGTDVVMHIKEDVEEGEYTRFLNDMSIGQMVKKYSDFIRWPIVIDAVDVQLVETGEMDADGKPVTREEPVYYEQIINSMVPIWQRPKDEVSQEESDEFYQNIYYDYEPPVSTIRVSAEGQVTYKAMLFIPGRAPMDFFSDMFEPGLQLYSNGVMIMERCKDVIPPAFRFVRGVVDSPDFPLNISRETLQSGRQLKIIQNNIEKKIKNELRRLMDEDPEKYEKFYSAFGLQLKYSTVENYGERKDLLTDLLMFYSNQEKELIPFREYKEKMPKEQTRIYYVCTDSIAKAESLPQTEAIRGKGFEILYLTDDVDDFIMRRLENYEDVPFCNITNDDLGLETEEEKVETEKKQEQFRALLDFIQESLGEAVTAVRLSHKLMSQPVYMTSEGEISIEMEKYFALMKNNDNAQKIKAKRVLELNAEHSAFKALEAAFASDKEQAAKLATILHAQALLIAGLPLENPTAYTELVCDLF